MSMNINSPADNPFASKNTRLPVAGKIRPGVMVLTKAAAESIPNAAEIYNEGVAAGVSFDIIERSLLKAAPGFKKKPLTPKNAATFRVNQSDFSAPGAAAVILRIHGENGELKSFPVVFPMDDITLVFKENFEAWSARELKFWSEPGPDGRLLCKTRSGKNPQARRRFGGREIVTVRNCDPNDCDVFAAGDCNHSCSLFFYVPGCTGVGLIELPFNSIYAAKQIKQCLEMVKSGLGRIRGVIDGRPIFRLTKKQDNVSRVDWKTGEASRVSQYIINIEAVGLDMTQVFINEEKRALGLDTPPVMISHQASAGEPPSPVSVDVGEPLDAGVVFEQNNPATEGPAHTDEPTGQRVDNPVDPFKSRKQILFGRAGKLGLTVNEFGTWGIKTYGDDCFKNSETLAAVESALTAAEQTGDVSAFRPVVHSKKEGATF